VPPGDLAVGARLVSVPGVPGPPENADGDDSPFPWNERVPAPGPDGTLLAVVPIPGTGTSLAIVGYAVATSPPPAPPQPTGRQPGQHLPGQHQPGQHHAGQHQPDRKRAPRKPGTGLRLDHVQRRVWAGGREITLTYQEFELLAFLAARPATVFSRAELVEQVWHRQTPEDRAVTAESRTVDVHISRLRHKLGPRHGQCLVTEYRVGYQFRPLPA
jgi:hypothetical protein